MSRHGTVICPRANYEFLGAFCTIFEPNQFKDKGDLGPTLSKSRPKRRRHYSCTYIAISAQAVQAKLTYLLT